MAQCQPGDLAVVIRAQFPSNRGKIVRVLRLQGVGDDLAMDAQWGVVWRVECSVPLKWVFGTRVYRRRVGSVPDSYLHPLRGPDEAGQAHALSHHPLQTALTNNT